MIVVSKCLLGYNCKYNCGNNRNNKVLDFLKGKEYIAICPETFGGLKSPREPSEIINGTGEKVLNGEACVKSKSGEDVTKFFIKGANTALNMIKDKQIELVILKANSPSCGAGTIYNGKFDGELTKGNGVAAALLIKNGYNVITEKDL